MQDSGSNYEPWGTLRVFFPAVRDAKSPAIESCADVLAVQYWTDWVNSAVAVLKNAWRQRFGYTEDASMDVELSRMYEDIQPQPN
jgi:hypothetical protein